MQPFPPLTELPAFAGDEIAQIWLDPWGVRFLFGSKTRLYAEHRIEQIEADGSIWLYDCQAEKKAPTVLQRLLYQKVVSFKREDLRLIFEFENGSSLSIFSDLGQYESGHIESPGGVNYF